MHVGQKIKILVLMRIFRIFWHGIFPCINLGGPQERRVRTKCVRGQRKQASTLCLLPFSCRVFCVTFVVRIFRVRAECTDRRIFWKGPRAFFLTDLRWNVKWHEYPFKGAWKWLIEQQYQAVSGNVNIFTIVCLFPNKLLLKIMVLRTICLLYSSAFVSYISFHTITFSTAKFDSSNLLNEITFSISTRT